MKSEWEKDVDWHAMQRDGLTPYREMQRWRKRAIAGWAVALAFAIAFFVVLQVLEAVR